ncbi:MAG: alcohol dehydrogenase catalytic domain-containing protein [Pseudomonadota bacterium]
MKAVKLSEPKGVIEVRDVDVPEPAAGEVLIKVEASGLCYTDVHICDGDWDILDGQIKRDLTLGHEAIGLVETVGPGVTEFKPGDRVAAPFLRSTCGKCKRCRQGHENHCAHATALGLSHDGSHADYVVAVADYVVTVPEGLSPAEAAPLVCGGMTVYGGLQDCNVRTGQKVGVIGLGGLGLYAVQIAKAMGAQVYAMELDEEKLELAKSLGADGVYSVADPSIVPELAAHEMDVVMVTAPSHQAHQLALGIVSFGGKISLCAVPGGETPLSMTASIFKGITYVSQGVATRQQLKEVLELAAAGKVKSHVQTRPLSEAPEAISQLRDRSIVGRVVFVPDH